MSTSLTAVRPASNRRCDKVGIRPAAPTISSSLDAARKAASVLALTQRTIDAEAVEIAEFCKLLSARLANVAELAKVVCYANGDWNEQLGTLNGFAAEASRDLNRMAGNVTEWLSDRLLGSATVEPMPAGKVVRK